jgi:hypothetical protein
VSIFHAYGPDLSEALWLMLFSLMSDGVHGGLALLAFPLPRGGSEVRFAILEIVPRPESMRAVEQRRLAKVLCGCVQGLVVSSWTGLEALGVKRKCKPTSRGRMRNPRDARAGETPAVP